jgi:transcriptional regulator with XRE-family HTH domain
MGVSRQYGWQAVNYRTVVSVDRAAELEASVDSIIHARRHLATLGQRLRAARVATGLTLKEVAELIGYSWVGVERWEKDVCLPKPGVLWHLLSLYGVDQVMFQGYPIHLAATVKTSRNSNRTVRIPHGAREELALSLRVLGSPPGVARQVHTANQPPTENL